MSGTPADATLPSANPGQAVTLVGDKFIPDMGVVVTYKDFAGNAAAKMVVATAVAADGHSATLTLPTDVNGVVRLQVLGSSSQPEVQIVPTLTGFDLNGGLVLQGSGFVEGASSYRLTGASVVDTAIAAGVDVSYWYDASRAQYIYSGQATLNTTDLPSFGAGPVTVTTAGGTSAALEVNLTRIAVAGTSLGDVAVDAGGRLWVTDYTNPGHLLQVDAASGQVLKSITMTAAWGTTYTYDLAGLQVLPGALTLGTTTVPAGSVLVFNGQPNPDRVVAIDPATGSVLASLTLGVNHDARAGVYDAASGHLFVLANASNQLVEIDPATGAALASHAVPINVQTWAGLAIDPVTGNLWVGSVSAGGQVVLVDKATGAEVRRVDLAGQGVNQNEVSGLAFGPDGKLWVSSTQGVVYKVDLGIDVAVPSATLSQVVATASNGTAAQAGVASANVGDVIELRGTNFGAGTQVQFQVRDASGVVSTVGVVPLLIDASGTRLQVKVPDLATTGEVRVVNVASRDLGFTSYNDAIYRQVTTTFKAGSDTALIRFADGGLEGLTNESWGLDNVKVSAGGTVLFSDDFEAGAKANWSDATVDASAPADFSRFSGRFNNGSQTLSLSGLTAGQSYTLAFDLYALDSWDGSSGTAGPDQLNIAVDGQQIWSRTISNYDPTQVQTLNASAGLRLQIVPTLTGLSAVTGPGSDASQYSLIGTGFMEGASTVRVGGVDYVDAASNLSPFDVTGSRNDSLSVVTPGALDGPVRITTEGGWAQLSNTAASWGVPPVVAVTSLSASAGLGQPADPTLASANTGQTIVFTGQGFTASTLVQFSAEDASGQIGTVTRTGSVGNGGTTLSVVVPANARSGAVTVLGSGVSRTLQIVPTLTGMGGTVAAGNTLILEGTGLTASDLQVQIDGRGVGSLQVRTVNTGLNGAPDQQLLTLTVPAGVSAGRITLSTAGGLMVYQGGAGLTSDAGLSPAADPGDTLATSQTLTLLPDHQLSVSATIGDGAQTTKDVDLYKLDLNAGDSLSLTLSGLAGRLRVFDANGTQLTAQSYVAAGTTVPLVWVAPQGGSYYVGVSSSGNIAYNPTTAGSGTVSGTGSYVLGVARQGAGSSHLIAISATAGSGTPAQASVASANTGQSITLQGTGLVAGDRLVFTTVDAAGNLGEVSVVPTSVDVVGQTLTALVPVNATTGHVRLARDQAGVLLQIVPTLSDVSMPVNGSFIGGNLTLTGTGFADGSTAVRFGAVQVNDVSQNAGLSVSNTSISMTVPSGAPNGPIQVITVGGSSAVFGLSLTGLTATAASGSAGTGSLASANPGQTITLSGSGLDASLDVVFDVVDASGNRGQGVVRPSTVSTDGTQAQVVVPLDAVTGTVRVVGDRNGQSVALQIVPIVTAVQVQSVAPDGSTATLVLSGYGFVEGNNSEYRFGTGASGLVQIDAGINTGAQVQQVYDSVRAQYHNGQVTLTVPVTAGMFGPISVKTAGGVSAVYTASLASVTATALSGTPADATKASANPGQSVTLNGTGLSTATDVLIAYVDYNGSPAMVRLSPVSASADGTSAVLTLPTDVNGVVRLQVLGSSSQPEVQIVPTLTGFDLNGGLVLQGSGFVEGASSYRLTGASVVDTAIAAGVDVSYWYDASRAQYIYSGQATLNTTDLPSFGAGPVTVTTAGGTSAALEVNLTRIAVAGTSLGDVAVDAGGRLWVTDYTNPGHLLQVDAASGQVLKSITMTAAWGTTYTYDLAGLQVLPGALTLGTTTVPAGSVLVFNGQPNPDRVVAIDPATGSVLASLTLGVNHDARAGVYDAASGHLFVLANASNQLVEIDPATGAALASHAVPINVQTWAGLAIDPVTGNLWVGSVSAGGQVVLVDKATGAEVRRVDLAGQGVNQNEVSGLAFGPDGKLWVSSTQGVVYKVTVG
jgi:hypothetical protein